MSIFYNSLARLSVRGKGEIRPQEGTSKGDSITVGLYVLGITPLMTPVMSLLESEGHFPNDPF